MVKTYAVAYVNFNENDVHIEFVSGMNPLQAGTKFLLEQGWDLPEIHTLEELKNFAFDCDCVIGVEELP